MILSDIVVWIVKTCRMLTGEFLHFIGFASKDGFLAMFFGTVFGITAVFGFFKYSVQFLWWLFWEIMDASARAFEAWLDRLKKKDNKDE